jgi:hypothetical protein
MQKLCVTVLMRLKPQYVKHPSAKSFPLPKLTVIIGLDYFGFFKKDGKLPE